MVKILAALTALSILNSSGASPGATEKVAALVTALSEDEHKHLYYLNLHILLNWLEKWPAKLGY